MTVDRPLEPLPGAPDAVGCTCPTVANVGYRLGIDPTPVLDPECLIHRVWHDTGAPITSAYDGSDR